MPSSSTQRRAQRFRDPQSVGASRDTSGAGVSPTRDTHRDAAAGRLTFDVFLDAGLTSARYATLMPATRSTPQRHLAAIANMTSWLPGSAASQCTATTSLRRTMNAARAGVR